MNRSLSHNNTEVFDWVSELNNHYLKTNVVLDKSRDRIFLPILFLNFVPFSD